MRSLKVTFVTFVASLSLSLGTLAPSPAWAATPSTPIGSKPVGSTPVTPRSGQPRSVGSRSIAPGPAAQQGAASPLLKLASLARSAAMPKQSPAPKEQLALPSAANSNPRSRPSTGYNPGPINGVKPRAGLTIDKLPETAPPAHADKYLSNGSTADHVSQEKRTSYQARADQALAKMPEDSKAAIRSFTGSGYVTIRQSEESGKPNPQSDAIERAFSHARPEPGTVYRGVRGLDQATVEKWIRWDNKKDGAFHLGKGNVGATSSTAWHPAVAAQSFMGGHEGQAYPANTYKVFFKIQQHSGIPVERVSSVGAGETEILMSRSAKFQVARVARWQGTNNVVVIELNEIKKSPGAN